MFSGWKQIDDDKAKAMGWTVNKYIWVKGVHKDKMLSVFVQIICKSETISK